MALKDPTVLEGGVVRNERGNIWVHSQLCSYKEAKAFQRRPRKTTSRPKGPTQPKPVPVSLDTGKAQGLASSRCNQRTIFSHVYRQSFYTNPVPVCQRLGRVVRESGSSTLPFLLFLLYVSASTNSVLEFKTSLKYYVVESSEREG